LNDAEANTPGSVYPQSFVGGTLSCHSSSPILALI
jgi:hypothetical protein